MTDKLVEWTMGDLWAAYDGLRKEIERLQAALESIANNTCCEGCQEARRVALAALEVDDG